jgi:hypothetical protein
VQNKPARSLFQSPTTPVALLVKSTAPTRSPPLTVFSLFTLSSHRQPPSGQPREAAFWVFVGVVCFVSRSEQRADEPWPSSAAKLRPRAGPRRRHGRAVGIADAGAHAAPPRIAPPAQAAAHPRESRRRSACSSSSRRSMSTPWTRPSYSSSLEQRHGSQERQEELVRRKCDGGLDAHRKARLKTISADASKLCATAPHASLTPLTSSRKQHRAMCHAPKLGQRRVQLTSTADQAPRAFEPVMDADQAAGPVPVNVEYLAAELSSSPWAAVAPSAARPWTSASSAAPTTGGCRAGRGRRSSSRRWDREEIFWGGEGTGSRWRRSDFLGQQSGGPHVRVAFFMHWRRRSLEVA